MALVIHIKKDQQIIINGAVIENITGKTISLLLKNEASILRSDDVLSPENAVTPASRAYYALQCMYLFPERRDEHLRLFKALVDSYVAAAPSGRPIVDQVLRCVEAEQYYAALKAARDLIHHEGRILSDARQQLSQSLCGAAGPGESAADRGLGADPGGAPHEAGSGSD